MADCSLALPLIEGIEAECLLADKAYDTNEIIATARGLGMNPVIPPKSNRREKRDYDQALYKLRHLVENGFLDFKQWRGVDISPFYRPVMPRERRRPPGHLPTPGSDDLEQTLLTTPPSDAPLQLVAASWRAVPPIERAHSLSSGCSSRPKFGAGKGHPSRKRVFPWRKTDWGTWRPVSWGRTESERRNQSVVTAA